MRFLDRLKWAFTNEGGYWAAAVALVGIGAQTYGIMSAPSGKIPTSVRHEMEEQKRRQDEAYRMQLLLQPFMLEQMGLEAVLDANGNMSGIRKRPKTKTEQQDIEIKERANEKVLKGLEVRKQGKPARVGPEKLPLFTFPEPRLVESAFGEPAAAIAERPFAS